MSEITPALRDHLDMLAAKAARQGAPLWDVLNAAQLLFTEDRRRWERTHALKAFQEDLDARSVPQLVGEAYAEGRATARDMRRGIGKLLTERIEQAKEGKA